jgi:hypothetical protein
VLTGFLRLLGGRAPRPAELTALRLAGLVAAAGPGAELTAEARALLARLAIEPVPAEPARAAGGAPAARRAAAVAPVERRAFARLELADRVYEMGEAGESGPLGFREADGDGAWRNLRNGLADGWTEIAAEIIGLTRDVELEYARTHVIRRRDLPTEDIAEAYELNGRVWWIRDDAEGGDLRCDDGDWRRVALPPRRQEDSGQERALSALFEVMPEARAAVEDEANAWVRRIAAGVRVVPVMSAV